MEKGVSTEHYYRRVHKNAFDIVGCAVYTFKWPVMCSVVFMSYSNMIGSPQGWLDWLHTSIISGPRVRQVIFVGSCLSLKWKLKDEKVRGADGRKMERERVFKNQRNERKRKRYKRKENERT